MKHRKQPAETREAWMVKHCAGLAEKAKNLPDKKLRSEILHYDEIIARCKAGHLVTHELVQVRAVLGNELARRYKEKTRK